MLRIFSSLCLLFHWQRAAAILSAVIFLCCPTLSSCLYVIAAKAALSTVGGVARAVSRPTPQGGAPLPQNRDELLAAYKDCLRLRTANPTVDCSPYRNALE